jgi:hypothetical protein
MTVALIQVWQTPTKRCAITPFTAPPPYIVCVFDGDILASSEQFETHHDAVTHAIAELRMASTATHG